MITTQAQIVELEERLRQAMLRSDVVESHFLQLSFFRRLLDAYSFSSGGTILEASLEQEKG